MRQQTGAKGKMGRNYDVSDLFKRSCLTSDVQKWFAEFQSFPSEIPSEMPS